MRRKATGWAAAAVLLIPLAAAGQEGDSATLRAMDLANGVLKAQWMDFRVEQVELLSGDRNRPRVISRLHQVSPGWVPGDPRRLADGNRLTFLVDRTEGPEGSMVLPATEAAIDRAMASWAAGLCLNRLQVVKRPDSGGDADIFDASFGYGGFGDWRAADIVFGGWMPPSFFDAVTGEGGGASVLAMSVTFVFVGPGEVPTDLDQNGKLDIAASEIYFNDGFSWQAGSGSDSFDIETVALHEIGHSLGIGHIDPNKEAAMNPVYMGARTELTSRDEISACPIWASWPH
jgi:hypothetical protein